MTAFVLDPRLAADTDVVCDLPLCRVLLMKDANWPWLVLVPRQPDLVEILDLSAADRAVLMEEAAQAGAVLRDLTSPDKLNVAALGNMVRQLHVHVIARRVDDPAWPGPVWGKVPPLTYAPGVAEALAGDLRRALAPGA
ncbi:HIT domain-containing protein [Methylobrevis pamukkalensis]|uniref:HIT domain protein n=1 Tax=Methylobrevis pamukkalensis TaxID=1439726 RepID=A0A1E3H0G7_9HYPH|nr:HIT family protein [Methylobrevis pamukkalensis]ODN69645.1 HIT domain protein [Methylobrevis pamukkalensis]